MSTIGATEWIVGGGELGELIRRADWATTPLGPRASWPQPLRTAVGLVVESPLPMALLWGPERVVLYNDGFRSLVGEGHPRILGRRGHDVWEFVATLSSGGLSYSPVRLADGDVGGALVTVQPMADARGSVASNGDVVALHQAQLAMREHAAREAFVRDLGGALRSLTDPDEIMFTASRVLGERLEASGVLYANVIDECIAVVDRDYTNGVPSMAGSLLVESFGQTVLSALKSGNELVIDNVEADSRFSAPERANFRAIGIAAVVAKGLVKGGRFIGAFGARSSTPRVWTELERGLIRETAERTWSALEASRAETMARESAERLRLALERSPIMLFTQDSDLRYTWLYDARRSIADADAVGKTDDEVLSGDAGHRVAQLKRCVLASGRPATDVVHLEIAGQLCWYEFYAEPLRDTTGKIVGLTGVAVDITDRKTAEQTQRLYEKSKERLLDLDAMERLHKVSSLFLHSQDRREILDAVLDAAIAITEADFGNVQVFDPNTSRLEIVSHRGFPQSWVDFWNQDCRVRGPWETAHEQGERVIVEDVTSSAMFSDQATREVQFKAGVRAVQSTPLVSRSGTPLGTISTHYKTPGRPTDRALRLLDLLARQAADLIDRARADAELRFSQSKYSSILMTSADAIISVDDRRTITEWNQGAENIFGYSRAEALGLSLEKLLPERHRAAHRGHVTQFAKEAVTARAMDHESTVGVRKNGEEFPISATISRVEINGQRIMTVAVRDVSEQKRIEVEQRVLAEVGGVLASLDYEAALEALPKAVVGALADFVAVLAFDEGLLRRVGAAHVDPNVSESMERMLPNLDLGHPSWQAFREQRPILLEIAPDQYEQIAKSPEHLRFLRITRPTAMLIVPLLALGSCVGVLGLTKCKGRFVERDTQLAAEIARRIALFIENARLHAAERRATKARDEVLGVVAHDLRNPLNAIVLQSGLLRRQGPEPERRSQKPVELIKRYATRMNCLIQDLLDVSQMEAGQIRLDRTKLSIGKLIHEVVEPHRASLSGRSIPLTVAEVDTLPDVFADGTRIIQVLDNLIGNARKLTVKGNISVGARVDGVNICVWVADTGPGVAPEDRTRVFDRFWQAGTGKRSGAGLGLAIVKGIVEAHGGRVWVESHFGEGSTFFFTVPIATGVEKEVKGPGLARTQGMTATRERSVLLAEDDPDTRESLAALLRLNGYKVAVAPDGQEALKRLQRAPRPDLVILDLSMPLMNGWELLESRRHTPDLRSVPFIVISAQAGAAERVAASQADFLQKPVSPDRLFALMESALQDGLKSEREFRFA